MYKVEFTKRARKAYIKLPEKIRRLVYEKLSMLASSPYAANNNVKPLQGVSNSFRLRVGDWRVVYQLNNAILVVIVVKIAHRKEVYR